MVDKIGEVELNKIYRSDCIEGMKKIPNNSINLIVTSPPYNIDVKYGNIHKNGRPIQKKGKTYFDNRKETEYRELLKEAFSECKRILKSNGSIWVNIKNRYNKGVIEPPFWALDFFKDMFLKNIIIWNFDWGGSTNKRFSPRYEYVFWFTKDNNNYTFNLEDIKIPALNYRPDRFKSQMKNPSDVWYIQMVSGNYPERTNHPAQYPEELIRRIITVASNKNDIILDPFIGSGTTARVAKDLCRQYIGYDTEQEYINISNKRLLQPIQRRKKDTKDIRTLYWDMNNEQLSEYVKNNTTR